MDAMNNAIEWSPCLNAISNIRTAYTSTLRKGEFTHCLARGEAI